MTIECLQSVYSIVHDNRMLQSVHSIVYDRDGIVKKYERGGNAHEPIYLSGRLSGCADKEGALRDMNGREPVFLKEFRMRMRSASGNRNG